MKKFILGLGSVVATAAPIAAVVACGGGIDEMSIPNWLGTHHTKGEWTKAINHLALPGNLNFYNKVHVSMKRFHQIFSVPQTNLDPVAMLGMPAEFENLYPLSDTSGQYTWTIKSPAQDTWSHDKSAIIIPLFHFGRGASAQTIECPPVSINPAWFSSDEIANQPWLDAIKIPSSLTSLKSAKSREDLKTLITHKQTGITEAELGISFQKPDWNPPFDTKLTFNIESHSYNHGMSMRVRPVLTSWHSASITKIYQPIFIDTLPTLDASVIQSEIDALGDSGHNHVIISSARPSRLSDNINDYKNNEIHYITWDELGAILGIRFNFSGTNATDFKPHSFKVTHASTGPTDPWEIKLKVVATTGGPTENNIITIKIAHIIP